MVSERRRPWLLFSYPEMVEDLSGEVFGMSDYVDVTACVWNLFSTSEREEPGDVGTCEWRYNV